VKNILFKNKYEPVVGKKSPVYYEVLSRNKCFPILWENFNCIEKQKYVMAQIINTLSSRAGIYSFNISATLLNFFFLQSLQQLLKAYPDMQSRIILEITEIEQLNFQNYEVLQGLKSLGVKFSIDDVPEKHSVKNGYILKSLNIPFAVKIDWRYFQESCSSKGLFQAFCMKLRMHISSVLAESPGSVNIVIEGVENDELFHKAQEIRNLFVRWQVPVYFQGFLFPAEYDNDSK